MIGSWDNRQCVFAVVPGCLKLGSNYPETTVAGGQSVAFPMYYGEAAPNNMAATLYGGATGASYSPTTGIISCSTAGGISVSKNIYPFSLTNTNTYTFCIWIDVSNISQTRLQFSLGVNSYLRMYRVAPNNGVVRLYLRNQTSGQVGDLYRYRPDYRPTEGLVFIAGTKNGSNLKVFLNGVECTEGGSYTPYTAGNYTENTYNIIMGNEPGYLYSAIMYTRALPSEEIRHLYELGPTLRGLLGYTAANGNIFLLSHLDKTAPDITPDKYVGMPGMSQNLSTGNVVDTIFRGMPKARSIV